MKQALLLLIFICASSILQAQPGLLSSEMMPVGTTSQFKYVQDIYNIDTNIQGANATWNFGSLINSGTIPDLFITIVNPGSTPNGSAFPDANYAWAESPTVAYRYFNRTTDKMERVGSYYANVNTFNDPQEEFVFPLELGTTNADTWDNTNSTFGGNYNIACIGYGTLTTPAGTFNDVLLVRATISEGSLFEFPVYFWYSSENGSTLLQYLTGDGFFVGANAFYRSGLTTAVEDMDGIAQLRYNNPVENMLHVNFEASTNQARRYALTNALGQTVLNGNVDAAQRGVSLDMSDLASGIYFMELASATGKFTFKVVKP